MISFVRDFDKGIVGAYANSPMSKEEFVEGIEARIEANKKRIKHKLYLPIDELEVWIKEHFNENDANILLQFCQIAKCKMK